MSEIDGDVVAEKRTGWQADPTGSHQLRYFSSDGRPTRLVRDGDSSSFDAPPGGFLPASTVTSPTPELPSTPAAALPLVTSPVPISSRGSRGRRRALTVAGIALGLTGLFGAGLAIAALQAHHSAINAIPPTLSAAGTTVNVSSAHIPGIRTITVWSLVSPANTGSVPAPKPGNEYAAAHIALCAGPEGTREGPDLLFFALLLANGKSVRPNPASTSSPSLATFTDISADSCIAGYVTFEIAKGTTPTLLRYEPDHFHVYEWRLHH